MRSTLAIVTLALFVAPPAIAQEPGTAVILGGIST